jgi:DNA-binding MarR family transcriptional regulator
MELQTVARRSDLSDTLERLIRLIREVSTAGDVSATAAAVLSRLGRNGPQRVTDLAQAEGVSQPAMSQLLNRLEHDGLIRREADAADRRGVQIELSERGAGVLQARRAQRARLLDAALGRLEAADRSAITTALPALNRLVDTVLES